MENYMTPSSDVRALLTEKVAITLHATSRSYTLYNRKLSLVGNIEMVQKG
jgi:hypothetical protein